MTAWEYMRELNTVCKFTSKERAGLVTNSELKRWLQNQTVLLNGRRIKWIGGKLDIYFPFKEEVEYL